MARSGGGKSGGRPKGGGTDSLPPLSLGAREWLVERLSLSGMTQAEIAAILGVPPWKLRYYHADIMKRCALIRLAKVADVLLTMALAGHTGALMFWLRARARWRDGGVKNELRDILSPMGRS